MGRSDPNSQIDLAHLGDFGAPSPPRARYLPPPPNQRLSGMAQLTGQTHRGPGRSRGFARVPYRSVRALARG